MNTSAATFLPASLFQSITNRTSVGMVFVVYDSGALFPITNATEQVQGTNASITTIVGAPILSATVGSKQNFSNLTEPVRVLLRLHELEVGNQDLCEKCLEYILVCVLAFSWIESSPSTKAQALIVICNTYCTSYTECHKSASMCLMGF